MRAGIHGYVPTGMPAGMSKTAWWSVPMAVVIGVPMYSSSAGIMPIALALMGKGAALGTTLAFMMAVIGLLLPETIILRKVLRPRLVAVFAGVVDCGIMVVGYFFNRMFWKLNVFTFGMDAAWNYLSLWHLNEAGLEKRKTA